MRRPIGNFNIPAGIWTFENWLVQILVPLDQRAIQMPNPSAEFDDQMPLPKNKCSNFW